jgi:acyl-coenzyme A thioesterase PaaI-like protein
MPNKEISLRKMRWMLLLLGLFKIPMVGFVRPKLLLVDDTTVKVRIRLRRKTRNHLQSMYFGALAVGADIAGGIHAFYFAELSGSKVSFAFKGMQAEFIQRAESDVIFESNEGELVRNAILKSKSTGERVNESINVSAYNLKNEVVAKFQMIVSVKVK